MRNHGEPAVMKVFSYLHVCFSISLPFRKRIVKQMQGSAELWKPSGDKRSLIVLGRKNTSALGLIYPLPQSLYFEHRGETVQTRGEKCVIFYSSFCILSLQR